MKVIQISADVGFIVDREALGRLVRAIWINWAKEQPDPKSSWLLPWEALDESNKEVDRRIGEIVASEALRAVRYLCPRPGCGRIFYSETPNADLIGMGSSAQGELPELCRRCEAVASLEEKRELYEKILAGTSPAKSMPVERLTDLRDILYSDEEPKVEILPSGEIRKRADSTPHHVNADADAATRLHEMAAKTRRFKGWRIRYELQRVDTTWAEVARSPQCDLRSVSESARWLRQKRIGHVRNVRVMRVFRKAKAGVL